MQLGDIAIEAGHGERVTLVDHVAVLCGMNGAGLGRFGAGPESKRSAIVAVKAAGVNCNVSTDNT